MLKAWQVMQQLVAGAWTPMSLGVAGATIVIIQGVKRYVPRVPGPIVALVAVTAFAGILGAASGIHIATVGDSFDIPTGVPAPRIPPNILSLAKVKEVLPSAFTIFLLGAIESLLAAVVADGMTRQHHDSNQELIGQGLANMASPLFGGIAATGAIARTATNVQNGAKTPIASLVHVGVVVIVLYSLSRLAGQTR